MATCGAPTKAGTPCKNKVAADAGGRCHVHGTKAKAEPKKAAATSDESLTKADMQEIIATKVSYMRKDDLTKVTKYVDNICKKAKAEKANGSNDLIPAVKAKAKATTKVDGDGKAIARYVQEGIVTSPEQVTLVQLREACKHKGIPSSGNKGPVFERLRAALR